MGVIIVGRSTGRYLSVEVLELFHLLIVWHTTDSVEIIICVHTTLDIILIVTRELLIRQVHLLLLLSC